MAHRQWVIAIASMVLTICLPFSLSAQSATAPDAAAKEWAMLVDQGNYQSSWDQAGNAFRSRVTEQAWEKAAATARTPLGAIVSRFALKVITSNTLPGLPDGQYAVVQFTSAFANKAAAIETVSLQMESGHWAVIGYFIR